MTPQDLHPLFSHLKLPVSARDHIATELAQAVADLAAQSQQRPPELLVETTDDPLVFDVKFTEDERTSRLWPSSVHSFHYSNFFMDHISSIVGPAIENPKSFGSAMTRNKAQEAGFLVSDVLAQTIFSLSHLEEWLERVYPGAYEWKPYSYMTLGKLHLTSKPAAVALKLMPVFDSPRQ